MNTLRVPDDPEDHAVTGGRDESLHCEGGHSPEHHTVVHWNHRRAAGATNLSDLTEAEHIVVNYLPMDRGHLPRTINHEGRHAE